MMLLVIFLFYKQMEEPTAGGTQALTNITGERFSGRMTVFLFIQIGFIIFERYLFLMNPKEWTDWETFKKTKSDYGDPKFILLRRLNRDFTSLSPKMKMSVMFRRVHFLRSLFNMKADAFYKLAKTAHTIDEKANSQEFTKIQDYIHNPLYKRLTFIKVLMGIFYVVMFIYFPIMGHFKVSNKPFCNSYFNPIERSKCNHVNENFYIHLFFILTTIYFILCALQIKYGESFLKNQKKKDRRWTMSDRITNLIVTKVPFVFEIKTALDFSVTKTSLGLFEWFKFEDIYNTFFAAKYAQISSDMKKLGLIRFAFEKFIFGWIALFVFLGIVLAPIFIFSNFNPDSIPNTIQSIDTSIGIRIDYSKFELYKSQNPKENRTMDEDSFKKYIGSNSTNMTYQADQMQIINLYPFGETTWSITPEMYSQLDNLLLSTLADQRQAFLYITFKISQKSGKSLPPFYSERELTPEMRLPIHQMMSKCDSSKIIVPNFYNRLMQITQDGLVNYRDSDSSLLFRKTIELTPVCKNLSDSSSNTDIKIKYWYITTSANESGSNPWEKEGNSGIAIFVLLDTFSKNLAMFTSVVAMYTGFVLIIGNVIRGIFTGQTAKIWTTDVPKAEQIIRICEGVTAARIEGNTFREEVLYWELVDIMRSPEMIKLITANYLDHKKKIEKVHAKNETVA